MKYILLFLVAAVAGWGSACSRSMASLDCGNGERDFGEECDDGNRIGGDGCSFICRLEGDGPLDTNVDSDDDTETSLDTESDSEIECRNGASRCAGEVVQKCVDGFFENWADCSLELLVCRVVDDLARCVPGQDTDDDTESDTDDTETDTEVDTETDTENPQVCLPQDCGGRSSVGQCWCDETCLNQGDCCKNVCDVCGDFSFCDDDTETETETDEDTDTNEDTDSETDTGDDSDSGQDTDTGEDTDTVEDTDSETDTVQDTDSETDTGQDTDSETDTGEDTGSETDTGEDTDSETDTVEDTDSETDTGEDTDSETDTVEDTDSETDTGQDTDTGQECVVDISLGNLPLNGDVSEVLNIAAADDNQTNGECGAGLDMVVSFRTEIDSDLSLSIVQIGDHQYGLYRDVGGACTAKPVSCYHPQGSSTGSQIVPNLEAGNYFLVVEGSDSGEAGTAVVTLSQIAQVCGNDILDPGEECDDGNLLPGDGCNPICQLEPGECVLDDDLGDLYPGEQVRQTLNIATATDAWATECSPGGRDVALRFTTTRPGDLHLQYTQSGNHGIGLYRDGNIETFLCLAEDGVCLGEGPDQPGYVIFGGLTAGTYFVVAESIGFEAAGSIDLRLRLEGCVPDRELGLLREGDNVSLTGNISAGQNLYAAGCAGESGRERIVSFSLAATQTVTVKFEQTGDHVFGLYEELGGDCDANMVDCHDPGGEASGNATFNRLGPGNFLLIVDAYEPGLEGVVTGTISVK